MQAIEYSTYTATMGIDGFWEIRIGGYYGEIVGTVHCDRADTEEEAIMIYEAESIPGEF